MLKTFIMPIVSLFVFGFWLVLFSALSQLQSRRCLWGTSYAIVTTARMTDWRRRGRRPFLSRKYRRTYVLRVGASYT